MIKILNKKFKPRIKARIRKNKQIISKNIDNLFGWVKGAELIELKECNTQEDPVRPELTLGWRIVNGRKIFGLKFKEQIEGIICVAFTYDIPTTVKELDMMSELAHLKDEKKRFTMHLI